MKSMFNTKKPIVSVFLILALVFVVISFFFSTKNNRNEIILEGKTFSVEIADMDVTRVLGLSGHAPLGDDEGMFFIFEHPGKYGFWMKDMTFPIDIIWIDQNFKIVHIENAISPETYPKIFYPKIPALYVLEIKASVAQKLDLKIADNVKFLKN